MLSPISRSFTSNPLQSLAKSVQAPKGDAKTNPLSALDSKQAQSLEQVLSSLEQLLEQLVKQLSGGNITPLGSDSGSSAAPRVSSSAPRSGGGDSFSPSGARAAPRGLPSLDGSSGPSRAAPVGNSGDLLSGIQVSDPRVRAALEKIATHPDGAKLIAAAKANGLSSISVNPGLNPDGGAGTQGETYYGNGPTRIELADANSPDLIQTLAHELGHAATTQDGDSQLEENTVDQLGDRIQADLIGRPSGFALDQGAYSNLPQDNGVLNTLRSIGIRV